MFELCKGSYCQIVPGGLAVVQAGAGPVEQRSILRRGGTLPGLIREAHDGGFANGFSCHHLSNVCQGKVLHARDHKREQLVFCWKMPLAIHDDF